MGAYILPQSEVAACDHSKNILHGAPKCSIEGKVLLLSDARSSAPLRMSGIPTFDSTCHQFRRSLWLYDWDVYEEAPVNRFVHEQNLRHLREVLARTADEAECQRIVKLIEREEEENTKKQDDRLHA